MKTKLLFVLIGLIISFLLIGAIRFITFKEPASTHYHANFAVFINGQKFDFSKDKYMEPVSSCSVEGSTKKTPLERVHLHNHQGESVHVHDSAVTWNNLINNLKFTVSKDSIVTDTNDVYRVDDNSKVKFVLNGNIETNPMNFEIGDDAKLLIAYGSENDAKLIEEYNSIKSDADELDHSNDPATCTGIQSTDFWTKVQKSFLF